MAFPIKDFLSKCDQIRSFLRIWSQLLKKSLMKNFIFCAVPVFTHMDLKVTFYFSIVFEAQIYSRQLKQISSVLAKQ